MPTSPNEAELETVAAPPKKLTAQTVVRFSCPEFTCLCPLSGLPDFARLVIDYIPAARLLESKSLKLFLASHRSWAGFHEQCTLQIAERILAAAKPKWLRIGGYWYPRGGIPIDVFYQTAPPPKGVWLPPQDIKGYRGR